ncbi:MAG: hypothetical protein ABIG66_00255 [Candidatus Kerfeldbacteria bacterium]
MNKAIIGMLMGAAFVIALPALATTSMDLSKAQVLLSGEEESAKVGRAVVSAGDVNGDGYEDYLLGAYEQSTNTDYAYLVYGSGDYFDGGAPDLSDCPKFMSNDNQGYGGALVSGAGDVNGDGYDDFLVGIPFDQNRRGAAYLVYGKAEKYTGANELSDVGRKFKGETDGDYAGTSISGAGDVNSDGYDDFLVGATWYDSKKGAAYLVYGQASKLEGGAFGTVGARFYGVTTDTRTGATVAAAGDVNGDGYGDFMVAASSFESYSGIVYVVYGKATEYTGGNIENQADTLFFAEETYDGIGSSLSAGDFNGDGYSDLLIGSHEQSTGDSKAHGAYLVYGQSDKLPNMGLSAADAKFTATNAGDEVGYNVASLGDANGDGYEDFVIGIPDKVVDGSERGAVYYFAGKSSNYAGTSMVAAAGVETATSFSKAEAEFYGSHLEDEAGTAVAGGDVNGDGLPDLLVGAKGFDSEFNGQGAAYAAALYYDNDCDKLPEDGLLKGWDTNGSISNNGVEISGDGVDNDGDGEIDEVNTLKQNGAHPEFSTYRAMDKDSVSEAIVKVEAAKRGRILVTYGDNSVYRYKIFSKYNGTKYTRVKQYRKKGFFVVLHPNGKKIAFINALKGTIKSRTRLSSEVNYAKNALKVLEYRDRYFAVVTSKLGDQVKVSLVKININKKKFGKLSQQDVTSTAAYPKKTNQYKQQVRLRDKNGHVLFRFRVTTDYELEAL